MAINTKSQSPVNRTVPKRKTNAELRAREYLTPGEVEKLEATARKNRRGHRDATMILLAFRHGLRSREVCSLQWQQVDFKLGVIHVNRLKGGLDSVHPLSSKELRALRKLQREEPEHRFMFLSERGAPMSTEGFRKMVRRVAEASKFPFGVHPHMLRHACGYKLANEGKDTRAIQLYMGHQRIDNTVIYTQLSADRFKDFWQD